MGATEKHLLFLLAIVDRWLLLFVPELAYEWAVSRYADIDA